MSAADLLAELRAGFPQGATSGRFDAAAVQGGEYVDLLAGLAVPATLELTSQSGWAEQNGAVVLSGSITTAVLGVTGAPVLMRFDPAAGGGWTLLIDLALPAGWTFARSLPPLAAGAVGTVATDPSQPAALIVASGPTTDPLRGAPAQGLAVGRGLTFHGALALGGGALAQLEWLISGGAAPVVTGPIGFDARRGTVDMSLSLAHAEIHDLFGASGPTLAVDLALWSGLDEPFAQYRSGIRLDTSLELAAEGAQGPALDLSALIAGEDDGVAELTLAGAALPFPDPAALERFFGSGNGIAGAVPGDLAGAVQLEGVTFGVGLATRTLEYAFLGVRALDGHPWRMWPGVIELDSVELHFRVFGPLGPAPSYAFTFVAQLALGGIPLVVRGELPGGAAPASQPYVLAVGLDPTRERPSLLPLVEHVLGHTAGLPQELLIAELDLAAEIPRGDSSGAVYSAALEIEGEWSHEFGTDDEVTFEDLRIALGYSAEGGASGELAGRFAIGRNDFEIRFDMAKGNTVLHGEWRHEGGPLTYQDIAIALGLYGLPNLPEGIELGLSKASFDFDFSAPSFDFALETASGGGAALVAGKSASGAWGFVFGAVLSLEVTLDLTRIDVVGRLVPESADVLSVSDLRVVGATTALPPYQHTPDLDRILGPAVSSGLALSVKLALGTLLDETLAVRFGGADDGTAVDVPPSDAGPSAPPPAGRALAAPGDAKAPAAPQATWIAVQRAFGPVQFERVGFAITPADELAILLDASVALGGLTIGLVGLEAAMPIEAPYVPEFSLAGLQVGWAGGGVTISGGLAKVAGSSPVEYTGELTVVLPGFGIGALGSYTTVDGKPSLFAYLFLDAPLGGPAFFFVTGLAGGFGYNRTLQLPSIDGVASYPLVAGAMGQLDAATTEAELDKLIRPQENEDWLAAGVRFTSFEMVKSFALLTVAFGAQVEVALMGESTVAVPAPAEGETSTPTAQAVMLVLVDFAPAVGQLSVAAQLGPQSYVLSKAAQLTGGFAFYTWFAPSPHAGDFVVTLGGYNPWFVPPAWYPQVPRLGLNWQLDELTIKGGLYFALTPSVLMAGGELDATWQSGDLGAWFDAHADFLIRFKPFHYLIDIGISIGVSLTLHLIFTTKKITLHLGVSLTLWGPPFGGRARIDLWIVSFTVEFGAPPPQPKDDLSWGEFRSSFLPAAGPAERAGAPRLAAAAGAPTPTDAIVTIGAAAGLLGTVQQGGATVWVVDPAKAALSVSLQVPASDASVTAATTESPSGTWSRDFGIGPMGAAPGSVSSPLAVAIERDGRADDEPWAARAVTGNVPAGLWLHTEGRMETDGLVRGVLTGVSLVPTPPAPDRTLPVPVGQLLSDKPPVRGFAWSGAEVPHGDSYDQGKAMATLQSSLVDAGVAAARGAVLASLRAQGFATATAVSVGGFASAAPDLLAAPPLLRHLGEQPPAEAVPA